MICFIFLSEEILEVNNSVNPITVASLNKNRQPWPIHYTCELETIRMLASKRKAKQKLSALSVYASTPAARDPHHAESAFVESARFV
jgi:hypothetical protein